MNKYHYVYKITEKSTNMKYIGVRSCEILPHKDLGFKYFSSSVDKDFINKQKNNPENFLYEVLSIYDNRLEAINEEISLHEKYDVAKNPEFYNKCKSTSTYFDPSGKSVVIDNYGNRFLLNVDDPLILNGAVKSITSGKGAFKDENDKCYLLDIDDPLISELNLVGVNKGKILAKDLNGNPILVDKNDERFESGELVGYQKGYKFSDEMIEYFKIVNSGENNGMYGKNHTEDSKQKMSKAKLGLNLTLEHRKKLSKKMSVDGTVYNSPIDVSEALCIDIQEVYNRRNSKKWPTWFVIKG